MPKDTGGYLSFATVCAAAFDGAWWLASRGVRLGRVDEAGGANGRFLGICAEMTPSAPVVLTFEHSAFLLV